MTDADPVPSWPELIILMCFGESEEQPFTGIVEVDDRYADDEEDSLPRTVRVHKSGARYRVETLAGELLYIKGADRSWRFTPGRDVPTLVLHEDDDEYEGGSYGYAIERPSPTRWRGDDFTTPTGPLTRTMYLGRAAWEIEIAPPPHKPAPIVLTVDANSGMQLRWHSGRFGDVFRWTEIREVASHPDAMFEWEGEAGWYVTGFSEVTEEDEAEERRMNAEAMASLSIAPVAVTLDLPLHVHTSDVSGEFSAGFSTSAYGTVQRRRRSNEPWDLDQNFEHQERWSDDRWDWCVASDDMPEQLASIRAQLAEPRPDHP